MNNSNPTYFLALAVVLYFILWASLHSSLGFLLDSDCTAYLTIAERMANGHYLKSVNGLWSPLNGWLMIPFLKAGGDPWIVAKGLNAFFGGVLLVQSFYFFEKCKMPRVYFITSLFVLVPVLVYYSYFQIFGDVLQLIFALGYAHLFISQDFLLNKKKVLVAAILMGIGFYAKAYTLVFFLLHFTALAGWFWLRHKSEQKTIGLNYLLGVLCMLMIVLPWSFQLEKKYGTFSLSGHAGKLNLSWYINSGKTFSSDIKLLIPPAYDDSPSFWEDPYLSQGELSTPFSSGYHFKRWLLRVGHTCLMALKSVTEISLFFVPCFLFGLFWIYKRQKNLSEYTPIIFAILILPMGYLAMHIETRYVWLSTFLVLPLGIFLIQQSVKWNKKGAIILYIFSFCFFPVYSLFSLQEKNKPLFEIAQACQKLNLKGPMVSNINDEGSLWVVSYLAGFNNYTIEQSEYSIEQLTAEMKRYKVLYYFHFDGEGGNYKPTDELFKEEFDPIARLDDHHLSIYKLKVRL